MTKVWSITSNITLIFLEGSWFISTEFLILLPTGQERKYPMVTSKEMMTSFPMADCVTKKRHTPSITLQLTLYSILICIHVELGQQETKISAEVLRTNGPWKAVLVLAHRVDPYIGWNKMGRKVKCTNLTSCWNHTQALEHVKD